MLLLQKNKNKTIKSMLLLIPFPDKSMLLRLLGWVGIGRCPYTETCGPETQWLSDQTEEDAANRICYTFEHRQCETYRTRQKESERQAEIARSELFDRY